MREKEGKSTFKRLLQRNFACVSCLLLLVFYSDFPLFGQQKRSVFRFEHLTVDQGLAHSDAMSVVQGSEGFIWIGTNNGVNRFDGYELKHYQLPVGDPAGVPTNRVEVVFSDPKGRLWVGTEHSGLYLLNPGQDEFLRPAVKANVSAEIKSLIRANITSISGDQAGRLWVATYDQGAFCLNLDNDGSIIGLQKIALGNSDLTRYITNVIYSDNGGNIWIGTHEHGLWRATYQSDAILLAGHHPLPFRVIRAITQSSPDTIWVGTGEAVFQLSRQPDKRKQLFATARLPYTFTDLHNLLFDSFGRLWVGTNFGLYMVNNVADFMKGRANTDIERFLPDNSDPNSLNSARIHQLAEDSFHNLWIAASSGGLNRANLQPKKFHLIQDTGRGANSLANRFVNAIVHDNETGLLWLGTRNGYSLYNPKTGLFANFLHNSNSDESSRIEVSSFLSKGATLWIGTRYAGLYRADKLAVSSPRRVADAEGTQPWNQTSIESIVEFGDEIWIATFGGGLYILDSSGKLLRNHTRANSQLPSDYLTFLLPDPSTGKMWISTRDAGVILISGDNNQLQIHRQYRFDPKNENSLKVNFAWPLAKDADGTLWIGTIGGGLHQLSEVNGKPVLRRMGNLIPDHDIESILIDRDNNLWLAGNGLKKFTPSTGSVQQYDVSDGLQSNSFKVGAAYQSGGIMYFGGINGVTWFNPGQIAASKTPPIVRITGLRVLKRSEGTADSPPGSSMEPRPFSDNSPIIIRNDENDFSFEFVALNYSNPQKQEYAFLLEGYNKEWVALPRGQRVANFANIPAGTYHFRVRAGNGEGVWAESSMALEVVILPPWWRSWWAYTFYVVAVVFALALYRKVTRERLILENRLALEKMKAEKEKEITEMKVNFFTSISHEFRTPLTLILSPMEEVLAYVASSDPMKDKVSLIYKQTRKLLDLVNQLLSFRKAEFGQQSLQVSLQDIVPLLSEVASIFRAKADELGLEYLIDLPQEETRLYIDGTKVEIILSNLLSNAIKFTPPGGRIRLSVGVKSSEADPLRGRLDTGADRFLEITVANSGAGIPEADQSRIFDPYYQASNSRQDLGTGIGLALVREYVGQHAGEIYLQSSPENGTTFVITLPFGKAHLKPGEIVEIDAQQESPVVPRTSAPVFVNEDSSKKVRMMIVEDNDDLRHYLASLFSDHFRVSLANDGTTGWTRIQELIPDIILTDIMMPGTNGLDLSKKIRQNPKTSHIPLVILTARATAVQELEGLLTGADEYMVKPFNEEVLRAKVFALLEGRRRLREYYEKQILLQPAEITIPDEDRLFLEKSIAFVEENLTNADFNVQTLVTGMNMSQSVFYRRLKSITGQTVIEFIKDIRLKRAAQLLSNPHARVSEVAFTVGIEDPKNFRTSFQKLFGVSPAQYAKQQRTSSE